MTKKVLKNELEYLIFQELYQKFSDPKAMRKAFWLLEVTIDCMARKGIDNVTLEMIAREASISRPLIKYYFADLNELKLMAVKYIRLLFQKLTIDALTQYAKPDRMLTAYIKSCFHWVQTHRKHAVVWLAFLHQSSLRSSMRELNSKAVLTGTERLQSLVAMGKREQVFTCEAEKAARMVQLLITGALISSVSENFTNPGHFESDVIAQCLEILGART